MNIKKIIIEQMPDGLNDLEKARFIYLKLAEYLNFSTKFQNTSEKDFALMYTATIDSTDLEIDQVNCTMWASLYSQILFAANVDNRIINLGHKYVQFKYNGKIWNADATAGEYTDLSRIKNGDSTSNFGIALHQNGELKACYINHYDNDMQILSDIDQKFSFYTDRKRRLEEIISSIRNYKYDNLNETNNYLTQKLEYLFSKIGTLQSGYYESKNFVYELEKCFFTESELEHIHAVELKRTNKNKEVDIVQCIYVIENNHINYYLLAPNNKINKVTEEQLKTLSKLGYAVSNKQIPGISHFKNFEPGVVSRKGLRYHLIKKAIRGTIIFDYSKEQAIRYR